MYEQTFDCGASTQLTWCTTIDGNILDELGLDGYIELGRNLAQRSAAAWEAANGTSLSFDDLAVFDEVFVELTLQIGEIDRPPLACIVLDARYRRWFLDVFLPARVEGELARTVAAAHALLVAEISAVRASGGCCGMGCPP